MNRLKFLIWAAALAALCFSSCTTTKDLTLSGLNPKDFETENTALYTLTNANGMEVCITNFGGRLVSVMVPDKDGKMVDVILGFDNIKDYMNLPSDFGASIGRYANRIGGASFELDGNIYNLDKNDGENCLHGGSEGWQYQVYDAQMLDNQTLVLIMRSPAGEMGFPGNVTATVIYMLTNDNAIEISFVATTDAPTVFGMTNHAYFNLSGNPAKDGLDQVLYINADSFTPTDEALIPTGEIWAVENTPMDFRVAKAVGQDIHANYVALGHGNGYDHNWILNNTGDLETVAASLYSPKTGVMLEVYTDQPGIQVYSGNFLTGEVPGKHGIKYPQRASVCLETQLFPDSPNKADWPSAVLRPNEVYKLSCI